MAGYPAFRFHKELAAEGRLVQNEDEDKALGDGWHDTPAKFDPKYVEPKPDDPAAVAAAAKQGKRPAAYPSHRFKKNDPDNSVIVNNADEDEALEVKEPGVWRDTPDPKAWPPESGDAAQPPASKPGQPPAGASAVPSGSVPPAPNAIVLSAEQKLDLHTAPLPTVFERLEDISNVAQLDAIAAAEDENPNGARKTLLKAVDARKRALANANASIQ